MRLGQATAGVRRPDGAGLECPEARQVGTVDHGFTTRSRLTTPHKLQAEARSRKRASHRWVVYPQDNRWPQACQLHAVVRRHGHGAAALGSRPRPDDRADGRQKPVGVLKIDVRSGAPGHDLVVREHPDRAGGREVLPGQFDLAELEKKAPAT